MPANARARIETPTKTFISKALPLLHAKQCFFISQSFLSGPERSVCERSTPRSLPEEWARGCAQFRKIRSNFDELEQSRSRSEGLSRKLAQRSAQEASARRPSQHLGRDSSPDELPVARVAGEPAVLDDDPTAEDRGDGPALDRPALPGAVVAHMKVLARERLPDRRIDDDEVGVAPGRDDALLGVEPEDPRGVRGGHLGEALERHPALHHALGEDDPHTRLRAEVAAGHVLELPAAELQLERRRELIGRRRRDAVPHEPVPERRLVLGVLERSEEHTSELQSRGHLVCRLLLEKKKRGLLSPTIYLRRRL